MANKEADPLAERCQAIVADELSEEEDQVIENVMDKISSDELTGEEARQQWHKIYALRALNKRLKKHVKRAAHQQAKRG